ncbi:EBNA1 binding 2 nucleolar p40 [Cryptosporidium bovis]|uniref:EBNA1 binding 2 nucleolar p40 n=1 Tax=Cryptosporidium bovis TaxID=310047 RepID=UPI003519DD45|nr:EBNA1 binding 2 nucleolar p40 [Cryptosporidium bovis]
MSDSDSELETRVVEDLDQLNKIRNKGSVLIEDGINEKINELDYSKQLGTKDIPFLESLAVLSKFENDEKVDYKDSIARESYFYENTLRNVKNGCKILTSMNINWNRPDDMLAEMLKTDQQMKKIKLDLLKQEQKIKAVELKKQKYVEKKFTKKIQVEKKKQRKQETKRNLMEIEKWKANRNSGGKSVEDSFDEYFKNDGKPNYNKRKIKPKH